MHTATGASDQVDGFPPGQVQTARTGSGAVPGAGRLAQPYEALVARNAELEQALAAEAQARQLAETREKLLRQVVHEQRSDLMNIALAVDLARKLPQNDTTVETIRQSIERIDQFLSDAIAQFLGPASTTVTALRPALEGALAMLADQMAHKHLTCDHQVPSDTVCVPLSPIECEQVIVNLLSNALKHAPAGTTITVATAVHADRVVLSIADQGPGIPQHLLAAIGDGRRTDPTLPGHGLGLRNVQALLQPVGGRLTWRNGEVGAVFAVTLPLSR
jgi:signal transduction histidine kinase